MSFRLQMPIPKISKINFERKHQIFIAFVNIIRIAGTANKINALSKINATLFDAPKCDVEISR
jgi:hypothetical protein